MRQWVAVEMDSGLIRDRVIAVYGPFDHKGLAKAFAEAYALQMQDHLIQVFELNATLTKGVEHG